MTLKPMLISKLLVMQNLDADGVLSLLCECGEPLTFFARERGTEAFNIVVAHGGRTLDLPACSGKILLWGIGITDPVGDFIRSLHEEEEGEVGP